jgi:eukaryotic-like serine/threonine-protein kinase
MITSPGLRLGERYVLRERLAVGGMGEVWAAIDEVLNRPVAVKVLRTDLAPDTSFQARFRAEARTAAALSHGGIAAVYDYGEVAGSAYLVMELVPGEPLSAMISNEGALGTDRTLQIVGQAARALHAAHMHGVIHRDIKPANLMVTPELRVKVTDFGIARPRDHEPLTATGQVMGTAHYLAPELARGEIASPLSDVYALGVVAYECLAGWRPFDGDNQVAVATAHLQDEPPPLPQTIPSAVRAIVVAAMSKDPAERPQGANALATLMEDLRLRGLAAGVSDPQPEPLQAWPSDAATPPRGVPPRATQHATRRSAALDRQLGNERGAAQDEGSGNRRDDGRGSGYGSPASGYDGRSAPEYPEAGRPPPSYADSGRPAPGGFPDLSRPPASYNNPGYPKSGFPDLGQSGASSGGAYPSRPRGNHGRPRGNTAPNTSEMPSGRSGGRPPRRRVSIPLAALLVLIIVVLLGSLWAKHRNSDSGSSSLQGPRLSASFTLVPAAADGG